MIISASLIPKRITTVKMISLLLSQLEGVVSDILSCTIVLISLFLNLANLISKGILSRHPENHPKIAAFKAGESFRLMIIIPKNISSIPALSLLPPHITSSSNTFQSFLMIIIPKMISNHPQVAGFTAKFGDSPGPSLSLPDQIKENCQEEGYDMVST